MDRQTAPGRKLLSLWLCAALLLSARAARAQTGTLADAYKIIASRRFVDLTHTFSPLTPVWKGFG
jgi:hypothetical protein